MVRLSVPLLLGIAWSLFARDAAAQVQRCETPDGQTVYTDRRCETIGAVERRAGARSSQTQGVRMGCARSLRDLYFEVSAALESRDVNRLAGVYHWPGYSTRQGYDLMQRLQAIVDRPLVDLRPIYPGDDYAPRRAPVGFRVEQTTRNGITPMHAVLGLRRHVGCWWVTLGGLRASRARTPADVAPAPVDGASSSPSATLDPSSPTPFD